MKMYSLPSLKKKKKKKNPIYIYKYPCLILFHSIYNINYISTIKYLLFRHFKKHTNKQTNKQINKYYYHYY